MATEHLDGNDDHTALSGRKPTWRRWTSMLAGVAAIAAASISTGGCGEQTVGYGVTNDEVWQPKSDRSLQCLGSVGDERARVVGCLPQLRGSGLSATAKESLKGLSKGGKIMSVGELDAAGMAYERLENHEAVLDAMLGTDEEAAAKLLREAGVRAFVVDRDVKFALDRTHVVLAKLAYRDDYQWFQLRHVTEDRLIYSVRKSPSRIPVATGAALLRGLRSRLEGRTPKKQQWEADAVRLIASLRLQGEVLAMRHAVVGGGQQVVDRALDELSSKLVREWERKVVPMGLGQLDDLIEDDIRIEVHVVMERAAVEPRSKYAIFELWEMGVDGMMFAQRPAKTGEKLDEKFSYMPGSELTTHSHKSADQFLRWAVKKYNWRDARPWEEDPRTQLDIIRTQHFIESERGGGKAVRLVRGMPEVSMESLTDKRIQDLLIAGGEWWVHNERPDKSFEYKYWPTQNRASDDYNEVRHILAARDLADVWRYRRDQRYLDASLRSMEWLRQFEVYSTDKPQGPLPHPPEGTMLFRYPSYELAPKVKKPANQKLGTVAVGLLGWLAWAMATEDHSEDDRIRQMARYTAEMQEADGRFKPYYVHKGHRYEYENNDIVPGEAMLALGIVAEYFDEKKWVEEAYPKFVEYYRPWFRERAKRVRPDGRWPHDTYENQDRLDLVQFGPWSVMAAKQYVVMTGDKTAAEFGLEVADWMIDKYQWRGENSPWPDYVGGYYKLPNETPAMQSFCYGEGTAAAYHIAAMALPERKDKYDLATLETIRFLDVMQFDPLDSYFVARPDKVRGGIKYTMNENKVRIDYVGHGLSTLSQYLDARAADPAVQLDIHDPSDLERKAGFRGSVPNIDYDREETASADPAGGKGAGG